MLIQDAIKSGKPFKRKLWTIWWYIKDYNEFRKVNGTLLEEINFLGLGKVFPSLDDILADDWEIRGN